MGCGQVSIIVANGKAASTSGCAQPKWKIMTVAGITPPVLDMKREGPERWDLWMSRVPMDRAGNPEELHGAAVYLASDASSFMTGST